ncbi:hypothetical protein ILYODFUR_028350, partial [Ilyodon furcidens]
MTNWGQRSTHFTGSSNRRSSYLLLAGFLSTWRKSLCFIYGKSKQWRWRPWVYQRRNHFGDYHHLLLDHGRFQRYIRLSRTQFEDLLPRLGGRISLRDTNYRRCIP